MAGLSLTLVLLALIPTGNCWFVTGDDKNCFCKVVSSNDNNDVIHDFGSIKRYWGWPTPDCSRLDECAKLCDHRVNSYTCCEQKTCREESRGKNIRAYYQASNCHQGSLEDIKACGC